MDELVGRLRKKEALANLCGESPVFLNVIERLPAVAKSEAAVLITGETGTGKEVVARSIHYLSERAPFPFVTLNCGSLPGTLLEDELFGHERGAFTDASSQRQGVIAQAEKGTLFLDEIDTLTPKGQAALLRVVQEKRFRAIGASRERRADIRVVAATNAPLEEMVRGGSFRADLYYRLCVFSIELPPLRDRKEDIIPLASHFLEKHAPGEPDLELAPAACEDLLAYDWPGNIRELENAIIRAVHLGRTNGNLIEDLELPRRVTGQKEAASRVPATCSTFKTRKRHMIAAFEKDYLTRLMREHHGNVSRAAVAAGKERRDFGKLLRKYEIDPKHYSRAVARPPRA